MIDEDEYQEYCEQYMNGYCMFMAAALHHEYKFPIGFLTITSFQEDIPELKYRLYNPTTLKKLEKQSKIPLPSHDPDVKEALAVAQQFLARELAQW